MQLPRSRDVRWFAPVVTLLGAVLGAGDAHADKREEQARQATIDISAFSTSITEATTKGMFGNHFYNEPAVCTKAIESGTAAGLAPTDTFIDGSNANVLWKRAPQVCTEYDEVDSNFHTFAVRGSSNRYPVDNARLLVLYWLAGEDAAAVE